MVKGFWPYKLRAKSAESEKKEEPCKSYPYLETQEGESHIIATNDPFKTQMGVDSFLRKPCKEASTGPVADRNNFSAYTHMLS